MTSRVESASPFRLRPRSSIAAGSATHSRRSGVRCHRGRATPIGAQQKPGIPHRFATVEDEAVEEEPQEVTSDDVAVLNREAMRDLAVWGRRVGMAVVMVAAIGTV